jgi:phenylpropionate dioxygenase-like ring-hydroxylating dioxygenase large terminal subunit
MQAEHARHLIDRLRAHGALVGEPFELDAARYRSQAWFERERPLFELPRIVATSSAILPGACMPAGAALLVRDAAGTLRAFANACRHRGTRLVDKPCATKAFVCPYHGWTYGLDGALLHVPHAEAFAGAEAGRHLLALPVTEQHGLVWLGRDVAAHVGDLAPDLAALGAEQLVRFRSSVTPRRCNWKFLVEAFLDGYHIRTLHRDSIYRFFLDAQSLAEPVGHHIRAVTARRALRDGIDGEPRDLVTPSLFVFPATTIVEHPDFISVLTAHARGPEHTDFEHVMLVPAARAGETEHWQKSWDLIEGVVFQREDQWVCEEMQHGLDAGHERMLFGTLEHGVRWFHDSIEALTASCADTPAASR